MCHTSFCDGFPCARPDRSWTSSHNLVSRRVSSLYPVPHSLQTPCFSPFSFPSHHQYNILGTISKESSYSSFFAIPGPPPKGTILPEEFNKKAIGRCASCFTLIFTNQHYSENPTTWRVSSSKAISSSFS
ncbi:hypothetical protein D3C72_1605940 [compost metagenome]